MNQNVEIIVSAQNKADAALAGVSKSLGNLQSQAEGMSGRIAAMEPVFSKLAIGATAGFAAVTAAIGVAVKKAADYEQSQIAFNTMLGSAEKGTKMLNDLVTLASKTPFEVRGIQDTAKQLLAMGIEEEKLIETTRMMGDVAAGVGMEKLPLIAYAFGQVKAQNKAFTQDLRQFMNAGIPILEELAEHFGITKEAVYEFASEGKIQFADVEAAMKSMTGEGGKYFDLMAKQAESMGGKFSTLMDTINITLVKIGMAFKPVIVPLLDFLTLIAQKVGGFIQEHPKLTAAILGLTALFLGILAAVAALATALAGLIGFLAVTGITIGGLLAGLGAIIAIAAGVTAAIVAIGVAVYLLYKYWDDIKAKTIEAWTAVRDYIVGVWEQLKAYLTTALYFIAGVIVLMLDNLVPNWRQHLDFMMEVWSAAWSAIMEKVNWAKEGITLGLNVLKQAVDDVWQAIVDIFTWAGMKIEESLAPSFKTLEKYISMLEKAIDLAKSVGSYIVKTGKNALTGGSSKRAIGGPVSTGVPYMVGENGPEMFVPNSDGRIVRNGGLGGTTLAVYIQGNTFMGKEGVARQIADQVMRDLQLRMKLS